jgi:hypothetical protein
MTAGHRAGAATVLLVNEANGELKGHEHTGMWIQRLDELMGVLEGGFEEGGRERGEGGKGREVRRGAIR